MIFSEQKPEGKSLERNVHPLVTPQNFGGALEIRIISYNKE